MTDGNAFEDAATALIDGAMSRYTQGLRDAFERLAIERAYDKQRREALNAELAAIPTSRTLYPSSVIEVPCRTLKPEHTRAEVRELKRRIRKARKAELKARG